MQIIIYYYLKLNILEDKFKGITIKYISKQDIKLPIPTIEIQNKIAEYLDMIYEKVIMKNLIKVVSI